VPFIAERSRSRRTGRLINHPVPHATPPRVHRFYRRHGSSPVFCDPTGRTSDLRSSYRTVDAAAIVFSAGVAPAISAVPVNRWGGVVSREEPHVFCDAEPAIAERAGRNRAARPTDGSGRCCIWRHGGACLRRTMFRTRTVSLATLVSPPRCLPAWSGVQCRGTRLPERRHEASSN